MQFLPEGLLCYTQDNLNQLKSISCLQECISSERILEAKAIVCDNDHNLIVDLNIIKGIIPRDQGALGIIEGTTRDIAIISKVNKPVCFVVTGLTKDEYGKTIAILSRRRAQEICMNNYVKNLIPGDIIGAKVTHLEPFGCFVDIGCGIASLIPIDTISISRISHPRDRFKPGQDIFAVVKSIEPDGKIGLSHKELLGTWEQNIENFKTGETVCGIVRSIEGYGIFIELAPNLAGLADYKPDVKLGQSASVYIKSLIPEKMKVKLIIVDSFDACEHYTNYQYFISEGHISHWQYSPDDCDEVIETFFD